MPRRAAKRGPRPQGAEVREALIRAAGELVAERGLERISMKDVAARAGVTQAMITYYFENRAGLWRAVMQSALDGVRATMAPEASEARTVEAVLRRMLDTMHGTPWLPFLMLRALWGAKGERSGFPLEQAPVSLALLRAALTPGVLAGPRIREDVPQEVIVLAVISMAAFPVLARPVVERAFGMTFDDDFREKLAAGVAALITEQGGAS